MIRKWAECKTDIVLISFSVALAFSSFSGRRDVIIQLSLEQQGLNSAGLFMHTFFFNK